MADYFLPERCRPLTTALMANPFEGTHMLKENTRLSESAAHRPCRIEAGCARNDRDNSGGTKRSNRANASASQVESLL